VVSTTLSKKLTEDQKGRGRGKQEGEYDVRITLRTLGQAPKKKGKVAVRTGSRCADAAAGKGMLPWSEI